MNWGAVIGVVILIFMLINNAHILQKGIETVTNPQQEQEPISGENFVQKIIEGLKEKLVLPLWLLVMIILLILIVK